MQKVMFGGGCFWCTEAVFQHIQGVIEVTSGYAGGHLTNPSYTQVCSGQTEHAEVILLHYDEQHIDFSILLDIFFAVHDPTTLNRQGHDIGSQYRSVIFYHTAQQKQLAEQKIQQLQAQNIAVVTQLLPFVPFYPAEDEHQNFFRQHPTQPYCAYHIPPKLALLQRDFSAYFIDE